MLHLLELPLVKKYINRNRHHPPHTIGDSVVLMRVGNITLEFNTAFGRLVVSNGFNANWVVLYDHENKWAADSNIGNKAIRERLDNIALAHYNYINQ